MNIITFLIGITIFWIYFLCLYFVIILGFKIWFFDKKKVKLTHFLYPTPHAVQGYKKFVRMYREHRRT